MRCIFLTSRNDIRVTTDYVDQGRELVLPRTTRVAQADITLEGFLLEQWDRLARRGSDLLFSEVEAKLVSSQNI
jgi:hypothetical protein